MHDCAKEGEIVVVPDECESEGFEVRKEHVHWRACYAGACTRPVKRYTIGAKDCSSFCGRVERPMQCERDEVVSVCDAREDDVRYTRVD